MADGGRSEYSYSARFSRSPTIQIDIKKRGEHETTALGQKLSFNLTTSQIHALYLTIGNFFRRIAQSPKRIKVKIEGVLVNNKVKFFDEELDKIKGKTIIIDQPSIYSYEAEIHGVNTYIIFRLIEKKNKAQVTIGQSRIFTEPATFKELHVLFEALGDFLVKRNVICRDSVRVFKKISGTERSEIGYLLDSDDSKDDADFSAGSENEGDWGDDCEKKPGNPKIVDVEASECESVSDGDEEVDDDVILTTGKRKRVKIWVPFPEESDKCVSRLEWMAGIDSRRNIFECIEGLRCKDQDILIDSFDIQLKKSDLIRMRPSRWANDNLIMWGLGYFASISMGKKYLYHGQMLACHPHGHSPTLIFGLFYMANMLRGFDDRTFKRWYCALTDSLLTVRKWCMTVNVEEAHFFFMVVWLDKRQVEVYDSIRENPDYYEKYFDVAKKTVQAAARLSEKLLEGDWSLIVNQEFPQQNDNHNCAFAMLCGIYDQLTGESKATNRREYVEIREKLAEVMYEIVPEKFKAVEV